MGKKVKVVFDTNVWLSIFSKKTLGREFSQLFEKGIEIYITEEILKEISKVSVYPKIIELMEKSGTNRKEILRNIVENSMLIRPKFKLKTIKEDVEDNKFLDCALQAKADFIISGDKHLLKLGKFRATKILTPKEFLEIVKKH